MWLLANKPRIVGMARQRSTCCACCAADRPGPLSLVQGMEPDRTEASYLLCRLATHARARKAVHPELRHLCDCFLTACRNMGIKASRGFG